MREAKIVIDLMQGELLSQAVLPLAQRDNPTPYRGHMLAESEVHTLNEGRIDVLNQSA
jgi:hypothetical protein